MSSKSVGDRGEGIALKYLEGLGYELVERNHRTRYGEIDLIVTDGNALVFVEVKFRKGTGYGSPLEAVTPKKQEKIRAVAEAYLADMDKDMEDDFDEVRFDVVGILAGKDGRIEHVRDAF